jgi:hypothetical protein
MQTTKEEEVDYVWSSHPVYNDKNERIKHTEIRGYIGDRPYVQNPTTGEITYTDGKKADGTPVNKNMGGSKSIKRRKSIKRSKSIKRRKSNKKLHRRK